MLTAQWDRYLELICAVIVAIYLFGQHRRAKSPRQFWLEIGCISLGGFIGEDSMIRAYHFYAYAPRWHLFLDQVPLAIVIIWPVVIHSAWQLARQFTTQPARVTWLTALIVLGDAALIEPVAVQAGLWSWSEPGYFAVPVIGVLGWAIFAGLCVASRRAWTIPIFAPLGSHVLLLASWWLALRWLSGTISPIAAIATAWCASVIVTAVIVKRRLSVARDKIWARGPGALFFLALLVLHLADRHDATWRHTWGTLWLYALAFAAPYFALLLQSHRAQEARHAPYT